MRECLVLGMIAGVLCGPACAASGSGEVAQAQVQAPATTPAQKLLSSYLNVQRRLAADDHKGAAAAFAQLKVAAESKDLGGDPELRKRLAGAAAAGVKAKDLAADRLAFASSSDALLEWLRREGNPLATSVHVAYCPMAMDGKGAKWLQSDAKVANPYYGSEMLTCGSADTEVKPGMKLKP